MISLLWLRRDLRLQDNLSLAISGNKKFPVQPIFIFDQHILADFPNKNDRRISLIFAGLKKIDRQLREQNSQLLVFYGKPEIIIPKLSSIFNNAEVFAGKDHEPYGIKRDKLIAAEVKLTLNNDHLIMPPDRIYKDDGSIYKVFTPYFKKWQAVLSPLDYAEYNPENVKFLELSEANKILDSHDLKPLEINQDLFAKIGYEEQDLKEWCLENLDKRFRDFVTNKLSHYAENRNSLSDQGTSCLSPYLRFGNISVRECLRNALRTNNSQVWISELAWRDFYAMILYYAPETAKTEMMPQYRKINWSRSQELMDKFKSARTGLPIIDAAVRQLTQTGWMHNRARMIVASYMTKNLWLDWRLGENFFAEHLLDYELSSNVGGWQWSASTGTDAQPYFRIFNPYLQSKKFDPDGKYIKKYLPELAELRGDEIHCPSPLFVSKYYWPTLVNYEISRNKAIEYFKNIVKN